MAWLRLRGGASSFTTKPEGLLSTGASQARPRLTVSAETISKSGRQVQAAEGVSPNWCVPTALPPFRLSSTS